MTAIPVSSSAARDRRQHHVEDGHRVEAAHQRRREIVGNQLRDSAEEKEQAEHGRRRGEDVDRVGAEVDEPPHVEAEVQSKNDEETPRPPVAENRPERRERMRPHGRPWASRTRRQDEGAGQEQHDRYRDRRHRDPPAESRLELGHDRHAENEGERRRRDDDPDRPIAPDRIMEELAGAGQAVRHDDRRAARGQHPADHEPAERRRQRRDNDRHQHHGAFQAKPGAPAPTVHPWRGRQRGDDADEGANRRQLPGRWHPRCRTPPQSSAAGD